MCSVHVFVNFCYIGLTKFKPGFDYCSICIQQAVLNAFALVVLTTVAGLNTWIGSNNLQMRSFKIDVHLACTARATRFQLIK